MIREDPRTKLPPIRLFQLFRQAKLPNRLPVQRHHLQIESREHPFHLMVLSLIDGEEFRFFEVFDEPIVAREFLGELLGRRRDPRR